MLWLLLLVAMLIWGGTAEASLQCYDCHGTRSSGDNRPLDAAYRNVTTGGFQGTHRNHLPPNATGASCVICHPGSDGYATSHRDGLIQLSTNIKNSPEHAVYNNYTTPFPQTPTPNLGTCSNVNCHFEAKTPIWGDASLTVPAGCSVCHGFPPDDGNHPASIGVGKKHGDYYGTGTESCGKCHSSHSTFAHATSAGNPGRGVILDFAAAPNSGGDYSSANNLTYPNYLPSRNPVRNGTCTNLYCHSDGKEGAAKTPAVWGGTLDCTGCHSGAGDTTDLSGRHAKHTGPSGYAFTCSRCHVGTVATVDGQNTIIDKTIHVNKTKDVAFTEGGNYSHSDKGCINTYCHSNGAGGAPTVAVKWTDTAPMQCYSCHRGRTGDSTEANCTSQPILGAWSSARNACTPPLNMTSNGHARLVGPQWIRKYPCSYCHNDTVDGSGNIKDRTKHTNGVKDVAISPQWSILGKDAPAYNPATKSCDNIYCHSDGTASPEKVRLFAWTDGKTECNTCHGHPRGSCSTKECHDSRTDIATGKVWSLPSIFGNATSYHWPSGQEWKAAIPMFHNDGPGTQRANSHPRHTETNFTCDKCHAATIANGACDTCHTSGIPAGKMGEYAHIDPAYHVNRTKDVVFKDGGSYNAVAKTCSNTACHTGGTDPVWGGSVNSAVICLSCHGVTGPDVDDFGSLGNSAETRIGQQAKISLNEWVTTGHGRYSSAGRYPSSGNPAANFPGNPCWYCHDNTVLHKDTGNPFRLRLHPQFIQRFEKECVYCHMERKSDGSECVACHVDQPESLAPQATGSGILFRKSDGTTEVRFTGHNHVDNCITGVAGGCHDSDNGLFDNLSSHKGHNANAGVWNSDQKKDVKNQYLMMGVCLQCHDDDSGDKCNSCHKMDTDAKRAKYSLGFDPGTGFIKPKKARASSVHFGYKHFRAYQENGVWMGGKFCWDCHDPHGDGNIYMVQSKVATSTEGTFGIPQTRADVVFNKKQSGLDYARTQAPYNGICNVCHTPESKHFTRLSGDGHNASRVCTVCHEHRFSDSHADKQSCSSCHFNKPVPRHSGFGQPRDCTKCHAGTVGMRMDVMGQMRGTSHHVQGVDVTNKHCYACHWESTPEGLIDVRHHEGYNYKLYTSVKNAKVDLVVWKAGERPVYYNSTTAVQFLAANIGTANERGEAAKLTNVCLSCHSDQNNDNRTIFGDCKTPRQYAWDGQSIDARYSQMGTTPWGKYNSTTYPNVTRKDTVAKALSAHGNAVGNAGGFDPANGLDAAIPNTRNGGQNVQCFDCHSSHGSKLVGVTSSYVTFNGTRNGGNLKETQAGKGGYAMTYKASSNSTPGAMNPYSAGAGQCFDCHNTPAAGITPWGYNSTFGATAPIMGYKDTPRFGNGTMASTVRFPYRTGKKDIVSGHMIPRDSTFLNYSAKGEINGLCTPCHDPHGVSPTLEGNQRYAVPLLKGTWMTSPYKEDSPPPDAYGATSVPPLSWGKTVAWPDRAGYGGTLPVVNYNIDRTTFGASTRIGEDASRFAGLCLRCHPKENLTDGVPNNTAWKGVDRVHESVKGWGDTSKPTEHSYTCSKCHAPHNSGLPRLLTTNCLDSKHRGYRVSGGQAWSADKEATALGNGGRAHSYASQHRGFPIGNVLGNSASYEATNSCHASAPGNTGTTWPDNNRWNNITPW